MASAWTPLANTTLATNTYSVTFSNIPNTFRDLFLVVEGQTASNTYRIELDFNGDTTSANYWSWSVYGAGSAGSSEQNPSPGFLQLGTSTSPFSGSWRSNVVAHVMDYSATNKVKTALMRANSGNDMVLEMIGGHWLSTSAISSLRVKTYNSSGWFMTAGTMITLYGVSA